MKLKQLNSKILSITVFDEILKLDAIKCITKLIKSKNFDDFSKKYAKLNRLLLEKSISQYIYEQIIYDENKLNQASVISSDLKKCVNFDLEIINEICNIDDFLAIAKENFPENASLIEKMPVISQKNTFNIKNCDELLDLYKKNGYGFFAKGKAFYFKDCKMQLAKNIDDISLFDLKGYEKQQKTIIDNTLSFIGGKISNNILLYGDMGTGKSSTVKAIVNEYAHLGLKIIELKVPEIKNFHKLYEFVSKSPFKFIVYIDDISFSSEDENFNSLKAFIEGGITKKPENMVIYATSNRRHIIKERFSDREGDEVHLRDALQSAASLSDRFGIEITFSDLSKKEYLALVEILALESNIKTEKSELFILAERFALHKSSRSPRTARQFISSMLSYLQ